MDDVRITRLGDDREIVYRVMSNADGPVLLHTSSPTFPMEMLVEDPMYERFLLTRQCGRLVLFDKPGTGASDPFDPDRGYFEQLEEAYLAVMDAIGVPAAWLVVAASGTTTALLASNHRDRLLGEVIFNPVDPAAGPKLDLAAEDQHDHLQRVAPGRTNDPAYRAWFSRARRMGASGARPSSPRGPRRRPRSDSRAQFGESLTHCGVGEPQIVGNPVEQSQHRGRRERAERARGEADHRTRIALIASRHRRSTTPIAVADGAGQG